MRAMQPNEPAINRLVAHNGGAVALAHRLGGKPVYQEIQRWLARGWASPMHILALREFAPKGVTVEDLFADRERARAQDAGRRASPLKLVGTDESNRRKPARKASARGGAHA